MTEVINWTLIAGHIAMIIISINAIFFSENNKLTERHRNEHSHIFVSLLLLNIFFILILYSEKEIWSPWLYLLSLFFQSVQFLILCHTKNESTNHEKYYK